MTAFLAAAFGWYLVVAALVALALLGSRSGPQQAAEVALTALMWPLYVGVLAGAAVLALSAIPVMAACWLAGRILRR